MRIVVNTRLLRKNQMDGIGWFTYNTLKFIVRQNPHIEFHFLFDSGIDEEFLFAENVVPHNLFPPAKHAMLNILWFEFSVKRKLKKIKPDLFFSPDGNLCLGWAGKQHGVIHDINFYHYPEYLKLSNRKYYNYFFPRYIKKATRIATVSEYSKKDISSVYEIGEDKIDVVYSGINSFYHPIDSNKQPEIRNKFTEGEPYFLFVGTLSPRKNVLGLMKAFELYKDKTGSSTKLFIVGGGMYKTDDLYKYQKQMRFGEEVIFMGRLDNDEMNNIYAAAMALVFVPFFEGFGLPPLEAMQCDVPVIASNVTSVPEIVGDAAFLTDPFNINSIAEAMITIEDDQRLRNELITKGRMRKQTFSWERTADLLWKSILKCV